MAALVGSRPSYKKRNEYAVAEFEQNLLLDHSAMCTMASQFLQYILPEDHDFEFKKISHCFSFDKIHDAFDIKLSEIVRMEHEVQPIDKTKVLGVPVLQRLQEILTTIDDIYDFASQIMEQSGVFLVRDNDQIHLQVFNNENELSPDNNRSINRKTIYIGIPSPEDERQAAFVQSLTSAFEACANRGDGYTTISIDQGYPRTDEILITPVVYCFPMRCAEWLGEYKKKYEQRLTQDIEVNSILLHSEGYGIQLPPLFVQVDRPDSGTKPEPLGTTILVEPEI